MQLQFKFSNKRYYTDILKLIFIVILLITAIITLISTNSFSDFGASGWTIFRKLGSTQFKGISTAVPVNGDISGFLYNPSILGIIRNRQITMITEFGPVEDNLGGILYGSRVKDSFLAGGFVYYDAGIAELNWMESGELMTRNVHAQRDIMAVVSFGRAITKRLFAGVSMKCAASELAEMYSAYAYAGDIGFLYLPSESLSLAFALQNMGNSTEFIDSKSLLPAAGYLGAGYSWTLENYCVVCAGGVTYYKNDEKILPEIGIELGYYNFSLNAGYRFSVDELRLHTGLKVLYKHIIFGYAFIPGTYFDQTHRLSISFRFDSNADKASPTQKKTHRKNKKYKKRYTSKPKKMISQKVTRKAVETDKKKKMREYFMKGHTLFKEKKYKECIKQFRKVLKLDSEHHQSINYIKRAKEAI